MGAAIPLAPTDCTRIQFQASTVPRNRKYWAWTSSSSWWITLLTPLQMFQTWSAANHLIAQLANDLECISHVPSKKPPFSITTTVTTLKPHNFWPKRMFKQTNSHNFAWVACHSCHKVNTKVNFQSRQNNSRTRYQRIVLGGKSNKLMIFGLWVYKDKYIYIYPYK